MMNMKMIDGEWGSDLRRGGVRNVLMGRNVLHVFGGGQALVELCNARLQVLVVDVLRVQWPELTFGTQHLQPARLELLTQYADRIRSTEELHEHNENERIRK